MLEYIRVSFLLVAITAVSATFSTSVTEGDPLALHADFSFVLPSRENEVESKVRSEELGQIVNFARRHTGLVHQDIDSISKLSKLAHTKKQSASDIAGQYLSSCQLSLFAKSAQQKEDDFQLLVEESTSEVSAGHSCRIMAASAQGLERGVKEFRGLIKKDAADGQAKLQHASIDISSGSKFTTLMEPTAEPTFAPTTSMPTTAAPTLAPTTNAPTFAPSTIAPTTDAPTFAPTTDTPTLAPTTDTPTVAPSTVAPTTDTPTAVPTFAPTPVPTASPTRRPTSKPTRLPTRAPVPDSVPLLEFKTRIYLDGYDSAEITVDNITATRNATAQSLETPLDTVYYGISESSLDAPAVSLSTLASKTWTNAFFSSPSVVTRSKNVRRSLQGASYSVFYQFFVQIYLDDTDFDSTDDLYDSLTKNLKKAVNDGDFLEILQETSEALGFPLPDSVTVLGVEFTDPLNEDDGKKKKKDDDDDELSDGEIAAIVICTIFGAALIIGLIYYFVVRKGAEQSQNNAYTAGGRGGGEQQGALTGGGQYDNVGL